LLGRRGLTSDAHPHWNAEVGYFLQRLEVYRGLAILTTNMKSAIDEAFLRRFRFVVDFPMPAVAERERIWRRVFPPGAPLDGVDPSLLARLPLAGGAIRNVALNAAFIAAEANSAITTAHVVTALRAEYRKLERPPGEIDFGVLA
jgi:SpoVK/Ycf46/Vps4 family AAA+-type ATPase